MIAACQSRAKPPPTESTDTPSLADSDQSLASATSSANQHEILKPTMSTDWRPFAVQDIMRALRALLEFLEHTIPERLDTSFGSLLLADPYVDASAPIVKFVETWSANCAAPGTFPELFKSEFLEMLADDAAEVEGILWEFRHCLEAVPWTIANNASRVAWKHTAGEHFAIPELTASMLASYAGLMEAFGDPIASHAACIRLFPERARRSSLSRRADVI